MFWHDCWDSVSCLCCSSSLSHKLFVKHLFSNLYNFLSLFSYFLEFSWPLSVFILHHRSEYCLSKSWSHRGPQGIQPSGPSAGVSARHDSPTLHIPVHHRAEMSPDETADPPFGRPTTPVFYIRTSPTQPPNTYTCTPSPHRMQCLSVCLPN